MTNDRRNGRAASRSNPAQDLGADLIRMLDNEDEDSIPAAPATRDQLSRSRTPHQPGEPPSAAPGAAHGAFQPDDDVGIYPVPPLVALPVAGWCTFTTLVEQGALYWAFAASWPGLALARWAAASRDAVQWWLQKPDDEVG
jgi:hypothetical protein